MVEGKRPQKRGSGFLRLIEQGVDTATRNNVTAYGYSVSITCAFALLQTSRSDTGALEIVVFAIGAVVAFALKSLAGALSFFSVGLALGVAYAVGTLIQGTVAWPVSAFLTTVVYVGSVGIELAVAHQISGSDE